MTRADVSVMRVLAHRCFTLGLCPGYSLVSCTDNCLPHFCEVNFWHMQHCRATVSVAACPRFCIDYSHLLAVMLRVFP